MEKREAVNCSLPQPYCVLSSKKLVIAKKLFFTSNEEGVMHKYCRQMHLSIIF